MQLSTGPRKKATAGKQKQTIFFLSFPFLFHPQRSFSTWFSLSFFAWSQLTIMDQPSKSPATFEAASVGTTASYYCSYGKYLYEDCGFFYCSYYCYSCDAGSYMPYSSHSNTYCFSCPSGSYQAYSGQSYCYYCSSGKHLLMLLNIPIVSF